jgi:hypothetical protein
MKLTDELPVSPETIGRYWRVSLVGGVVVLGAVAGLLHTLTSTAEQIQAGTGQIWTTGKLIARNTVQIPLLVRTNQMAGEILQAADGIAAATGRIGKAVGLDPDAGGTPEQ